MREEVVTNVVENQIEKVVCGKFSTFIILEDGKLLATGKNIDGQLGIGYDESGLPYYGNVYEFKYTGINNADKVITGGNNTFVITKDNKLLATGCNRSGELGLGDDDNRLVFTEITKRDTDGWEKIVEMKAKDINQIVAGDEFTFIVGFKESLYFAGRKSLFSDKLFVYDYISIFKHLFLDRGKKICDAEIRDVKQIACGMGHVCIIGTGIEENKKLLTIGSNKYGQLGLHDKSNRNGFTTTDIVNPKEVICGKYHTFVITDDGKLLATGNNEYGQLGLGDFKNRYGFIDTGIRNPRQVICGYFHTFIITEDGELLGTGKNDNGELCLNHRDKVCEFTPVGLNNIKSISCSFDHTVILTNDNKLIRKGSNEYGQLGYKDNEINKDNISIIKRIINKFKSII